MKILVTGSNGLLGRAFCQTVVNNHSITAVVKNTPKEPLKNIEYFPLDLSTEWALRSKNSFGKNPQKDGLKGIRLLQNNH